MNDPFYDLTDANLTRLVERLKRDAVDFVASAADEDLVFGLSDRKKTVCKRRFDGESPQRFRLFTTKAVCSIAVVFISLTLFASWIIYNKDYKHEGGGNSQLIVSNSETTSSSVGVYHENVESGNEPASGFDWSIENMLSFSKRKLSGLKKYEVASQFVSENYVQTSLNTQFIFLTPSFLNYAESQVIKTPQFDKVQNQESGSIAKDAKTGFELLQPKEILLASLNVNYLMLALELTQYAGE